MPMVEVSNGGTPSELTISTNFAFTQNDTVATDGYYEIPNPYNHPYAVIKYQGSTYLKISVGGTVVVPRAVYGWSERSTAKISLQGNAIRVDLTKVKISSCSVVVYYSNS